MDKMSFLTSLVTWYVIIPAALLCLAPMKNQLKYDRKKVYLITVITFLILSLIIAIIKANFSIPRYALMPLMIIPAFIMFSIFTRSPIYKNLSVFVLVFAFMSFIVNISTGFDAVLHPTGTLNNFSLEAAIFQAVFTTLFILVLYYPASHQATTIIDKVDSPRVYVASIPVWGVFLVFNLLVSPRKYETIHVNHMPIAFWGTMLLFLILLFLLCILFYYIVSDLMDKAEMQEKTRMLEMQESSYRAQKRYIEENAKVRHDFKHVIATLDELTKEGDIAAIRSYLDEYIALQPKKVIQDFCKNPAVNAVLNHYLQRARSYEIKVDWEIDMPEELKVTDVDICSIIGNILENAILACMEVEKKDRFIDFGIRAKKGGSIYIVVTNSFSGTVRMKDGDYMSTRINGHGIGLKSITSTAAKYGGSARFSHEGNEFYTDVIL